MVDARIRNAVLGGLHAETFAAARGADALAGAVRLPAPPLEAGAGLGPIGRAAAAIPLGELRGPGRRARLAAAGGLALALEDAFATARSGAPLPDAAEALWADLVRAALAEPRTHLHFHFWFSEVLRARLDALLAADPERWRDLRAVAQDAISAGINLRQRGVDDAVETAGAFYREPRLGPVGAEGSRDPVRVLGAVAFALSFGGGGLERAFRVLAAGPGDPGFCLAVAGRLAGAFLGDRLAEALPGHGDAGPALRAAFEAASGAALDARLEVLENG
ncbi:MAG: hypothetical protein R3F20_14480 [Planctomycetota bacterium]